MSPARHAVRHGYGDSFPQQLCDSYANPAPARIPGNYGRKAQRHVPFAGYGRRTRSPRRRCSGDAKTAYCFGAGAIVAPPFFAAGVDAGLVAAACAGRYFATMAGSTCAM